MRNLSSSPKRFTGVVWNNSPFEFTESFDDSGWQEPSVAAYWSLLIDG
jgi:hypothetical protein